MDKGKEYNDAFGDGFGDYVLSQSSDKSINVLRIKDDLRSFCLDPLFFIAYANQQYGFSPELSERMRQTLLREMHLSRVITNPSGIKEKNE